MNPTDEYAERLRLRERSLAAAERLQQRLSNVRLALAVAFLALAWCCAGLRMPSPLWLLVPGALFVGAVIYHQRIRLVHGNALRAVAFYRAGLDRLRGQAAASAQAGGEFNDPHHVYAADLDLFGEGSLYALLCTARTPMGEAALARWLLQPADVSTIHARQAGIAELRTRLDFREELAILGGRRHITLEPGALATWLDGPDELAASWLAPAATSLGVLAGIAALILAFWGLAFPLLAVLAAEALLHRAFAKPVQRCVGAIEHAYEDLKLLAALLRRVESETFDAPVLSDLRQRLASRSASASATLAGLATLVNFIEARRNPFLAPLQLPLLYPIQSALAAERWRRRHGRAVGAWLAALGELEALQSIAGYSFERPDHTIPEFVEGPARFTAVGLGHPLLPAASRVCNDVEIDGSTRVLLVSGSNMSGKSTLLRAVGINAVLAMAGAPVCAARLELTPLQVGASIRVNDSLREGSSRFYAEITRLRQLFEPSALPLLFLLDELLQGTNSTDRRIGAQGVVRALIQRGAIGLISTHDLSLTEGDEFPAGALCNVHFQDELREGRLTFDFTLRAGLLTKSNGIELMRAIGLDV